MTGWDLLLILVTSPIWISFIIALFVSVFVGVSVWATFIYFCFREIKRGYE